PRDTATTAVSQAHVRGESRVELAAHDAAEDRVLDVLIPPSRPSGGFGFDPEASRPSEAESATRQKFRKRLREGDLDDREIEIDVAQAMPSMELMGPAGMEDLTQQLQSMFSNLPGRKRTRKMKIAEALRVLADEEAGKLVNEEDVK